MKIWAKVMNADRILRDIVYEGDHKFTPSGFRDAVQNVSYLLDVSTPVLLPAHYRHFENFKRVKFLPSDFIEDVGFTSYVLELVSDDKAKKLQK